MSAVSAVGGVGGVGGLGDAFGAVGVAPSALSLEKIPGFERSAYARLNGRIVWAGQGAVTTDHPRHAGRPWQPAPFVADAEKLAVGALRCWRHHQPPPGESRPALPGLLAWLCGQALPFPLEGARARFDAVRDALVANDATAFEAAALRVLGLGPGLTPSGDDFVGAIFFALAHAPRPAWRAAMPGLQARVQHAAQAATNPISAALLEDLMAGASYRVLHELLAALQGGQAQAIGAASAALLSVGASSGADLLAGLLLALTTQPVSGPGPFAGTPTATAGACMAPS